MLYLLTMCVDSKLFGVVWFPEKTCFFNDSIWSLRDSAVPIFNNVAINVSLVNGVIIG